MTVVAGLVPATSILLALCSAPEVAGTSPATPAGCDSKRSKSAVGCDAQPLALATRSCIQCADRT